MSELAASKNLFFRLFPPPAYLLMPSVGIDVSDEAIKIIEFTQGKRGLSLAQYRTVEIAKGAIEKGKIVRPEYVVDALRKLKIENGVGHAHASLPDEHAYLFQTELSDELPFDQIRTTIEFKLKENIPLSPEEVQFDFELLPSMSGGRSRFVSVSAYPRELIEMYHAAFIEAGMMVLSFETESEANARAIMPFGSNETVIVIDIGKVGTELSVVSFGQVLFTTSLEVCGDDFTHTIERFLQVSFSEAERIKSIRGFIKSDENNDLFEALLGSVSNLRDEINKHLTYWHMHKSGRKSFHYDVEKIILSGGGSNLPGLKDYLVATMSLPVVEANVWTNATSFDHYIPPIERTQSLSYATAIGLGLKSFL